ncbi:MAG: 50S ribosomal protein L11 methyltransferase [Glaciecola sp.]
MAWQQLKINVKVEHAELVGDVLSEHHAQAVTFLDAKDTPMYEPKPGEIMLWPDTQVIGLYDVTVELRDTVTAIYQAVPPDAEIEHVIDQLEDKDWEREWMENFHPMKFGDRLWICPSWRDVPDPKAVNILLDPGLAFGTGTHPTTALCLKWLDKAQVKGKTVVDFGCGSGVLAIAALKLGAERVIGIDIDPQALLASKDNAQRNGVDTKLELYLPENQPTVHADVVIANVLAAPLKELSDVVSALCAVGGNIVMSGILVEQAQSVIDVYAEKFSFSPIVADGEWTRLTGVKKNN